MTRRAPRPRRTRLAATAVAGLAACALGACTSTFDSSATTPPSVVPSTTAFTVAGSTDEQLGAIAAEVGALSEKLVDNEGQREALARIQAQWEAARPVIEGERPELLAGFDSALAQVERAVERRRPADADKAARSLASLIAAYTG